MERISSVANNFTNYGESPYVDMPPPEIRQKTFWGFLVCIKKRKKNDLSDLLRYMHLLDAGYAFEHISIAYGIHAAHLKVLRSKYLQQGPVGLKKVKTSRLILS